MNGVDPAPTFATISDLGLALRSGQTTAVALANEALRRLESTGRAMNAVVTTTTETALALAARADEELANGHDRGALHGIPYGAKDLLAVAGYPTTWGAAPFRNRYIENNAAVVERLEAAGAVLVAKLAMVEFAGGFGYDQPDAAFTGPGRNAWNPERWAGGSSSGSGAAVAAGCVPLAIGSETWGSIHGPAAYNAITGFRPTYGLVSRHGAMALSWTMDKMGPMAHSVEDCELTLLTLAGHDPRDPSTLHRSAYQCDQRREGFRFATLTGATIGVEAEVADRYHEALRVFHDFGSVDEIRLPELPFDAAAATIISAEAASAFETFLEEGGAAELTALEDRVALLGAQVINGGKTQRALRVRRKAMAAIDELLAPFDAVITPGRATVAPPIDQRFLEEPNDPGARTIDGAANLCGLPGLMMPMGLGRHGLPAAVGLTGRAELDATILAVGIAFQERTGFHREMPPEPAANARDALHPS